MGWPGNSLLPPYSLIYFRLLEHGPVQPRLEGTNPAFTPLQNPTHPPPPPPASRSPSGRGRSAGLDCGALGLASGGPASSCPTTSEAPRPSCRGARWPTACEPERHASPVPPPFPAATLPIETNTNITKACAQRAPLLLVSRCAVCVPRQVFGLPQLYRE